MNPRLVPYMAGLAILAVAGCAAVDPLRSKAWSIEPVMETRHAGPSTHGYYVLGRYHDGMRAFEKAVEAYRKSIAADTANVEAYNALGVALAQLGRYGEAEGALRNGMRLDAGRAHMHSNLGYVLLLAGKFREAAAVLKNAVKMDPANATAFANLRPAVAGAEAQPAAAAGVAGHAAPAAQAEAPRRASAALPPPAAAQSFAEQSRNETAPSMATATITDPSSGKPVRLSIPLRVAAPAPVREAPVVTTAEAPGSAPESFMPVRMQVSDKPTAPAFELSTHSPGGVVMTPLPALAGAAREPGAPPASAQALELSNGNGVRGAAALLKRWLETQGIVAGRLTNQRPFAQQQTVVQYAPGSEQAAQRLASRLPLGAEVDAAPRTGLRADVRVVLGRDWSQAGNCPYGDACRPVAALAAPQAR